MRIRLERCGHSSLARYPTQIRPKKRQEFNRLSCPPERGGQAPGLDVTREHWRNLGRYGFSRGHRYRSRSKEASLHAMGIRVEDGCEWGGAETQREKGQIPDRGLCIKLDLVGEELVSCWPAHNPEY